MTNGAALSKIKKKLLPTTDGQDVLRLRAGVVTAVNSDGTCDVVLNGQTVPGVNRLAEASVAVGAVVQMVSYRGSMLIIGRSAGGIQSAGLGLWARGQSTSNSGAISNTLTSVLVTNTVTFLKNRVYECKTHGGVQGTSGTFIDQRVYRDGPATQLGEFYRTPITAGSAAFNTDGHGVYFTTAADVTGAIALYVASSSGVSTVVHIGTATGTPRNIEVWDVGDASQFPGITTW